MIPTQPQIECSGVSHSYGRRQSLRSVSLELHIGVTGLLGPNGAGKSTLMKLLSTALPLQQGEIVLAGTPLRPSTREQVRAKIGYLPQRFELMGWSSVRRNVEYAAWANGLDGESLDAAVVAILEAVGLFDRASSRARALSGGMRQRLGLACAMVHRPSVLILDEPTVGLDPSQRRALRETILAFAQDSLVLLSTHLVEDLAEIAREVIVMSEGEVRFQDSINGLRQLGERTPGQSSPLEAGYHAALLRGHGMGGSR